MYNKWHLGECFEIWSKKQKKAAAGLAVVASGEQGGGVERVGAGGPLVLLSFSPI